MALVTGGGQGIGRAISEAFGREGARVAVLDLKPEVAEEAAAAIRAAGGEAIALGGNVAKREDVFGAVHYCLAVSINALSHCSWVMPLYDFS